MGPFQYVSRLTYAWSAALILLGVPILLAAVVALLVPEATEFASFLNKACTIVLALLTGGRVADAGYQYWVGAIPVVVIGLGVAQIAGPVLVLLELDASVRELSELVVMAVTLVSLIGFAVWAGTRKPVPRQGAGEKPGDKRESRPTGPRI
jgi:hypothetical protein